MSQIIKAFTGIFCVLLLTVSATQLLGVFFMTLQAQDLHGEIIDELENSNFSKEVLYRAYEVAESRNGYLEVLLYDEDGSIYAIGTKEDIPTQTGRILLAKVTLGYPVTMKFFGWTRQQTLSGYAR